MSASSSESVFIWAMYPFCSEELLLQLDFVKLKKKSNSDTHYKDIRLRICRRGFENECASSQKSILGNLDSKIV